MRKKGETVRFSVSLPARLVERFNVTYKTMGYRSRSKAIHDAIGNFISEFEWMKEDSERISGAISVLYYLDKPGLVQEIINTKKNFAETICSTMNVIVNENKCMDIIVVRGASREISGLVKALAVKRGVRQVKTALLTL
jgi:CopG family nickel-responsive transcriptional regulator